jgi:stalled ribosome rescue protein Dom34
MRTQAAMKFNKEQTMYKSVKIMNEKKGFMWTYTKIKNTCDLYEATHKFLTKEAEQEHSKKEKQRNTTTHIIPIECLLDVIWLAQQRDLKVLTK